MDWKDSLQKKHKEITGLDEPPKPTKKREKRIYTRKPKQSTTGTVEPPKTHESDVTPEQQPHEGDQNPKQQPQRQNHTQRNLPLNRKIHHAPKIQKRTAALKRPNPHAE